eukprot:1850568-Prymnesium_polylepis.2
MIRTLGIRIRSMLRHQHLDFHRDVAGELEELARHGKSINESGLFKTSEEYCRQLLKERDISERCWKAQRQLLLAKMKPQLQAALSQMQQQNRTWANEEGRGGGMHLHHVTNMLAALADLKHPQLEDAARDPYGWLQRADSEAPLGELDSDSYVSEYAKRIAEQMSISTFGHGSNISPLGKGASARGAIISTMRNTAGLVAAAAAQTAQGLAASTVQAAAQTAHGLAASTVQKLSSWTPLAGAAPTVEKPSNRTPLAGVAPTVHKLSNRIPVTGAIKASQPRELAMPRLSELTPLLCRRFGRSSGVEQHAPRQPVVKTVNVAQTSSYLDAWERLPMRVRSWMVPANKRLVPRKGDRLLAINGQRVPSGIWVSDGEYYDHTPTYKMLESVGDQGKQKLPQTAKQLVVRMLQPKLKPWLTALGISFGEVLPFLEYIDRTNRLLRVLDSPESFFDVVSLSSALAAKRCRALLVTKLYKRLEPLVVKLPYELVFQRHASGRKFQPLKDMMVLEAVENTSELSAALQHPERFLAKLQLDERRQGVRFLVARIAYARSSKLAKVLEEMALEWDDIALAVDIIHPQKLLQTRPLERPEELLTQIALKTPRTMTGRESLLPHVLRRLLLGLLHRAVKGELGGQRWDDIEGKLESVDDEGLRRDPVSYTHLRAHETLMNL